MRCLCTVRAMAYTEAGKRKTLPSPSPPQPAPPPRLHDRAEKRGSFCEVALHHALWSYALQSRCLHHRHDPHSRSAPEIPTIMLALSSNVMAFAPTMMPTMAPVRASVVMQEVCAAPLSTRLRPRRRSAPKRWGARVQALATAFACVLALACVEACLVSPLTLARPALPFRALLAARPHAGLPGRRHRREGR